MGLMTNLQQLNLEDNGLSGYVPDELFNMSSLTHLNLAWQYTNGQNCTSSNGNLVMFPTISNFGGLEGSILEKIKSLRHLREIIIENNYFSGEITPGIKNLKQLGKGLIILPSNFRLYSSDKSVSMNLTNMLLNRNT